MLLLLFLFSAHPKNHRIERHNQPLVPTGSHIPLRLVWPTENYYSIKIIQSIHQSMYAVSFIVFTVITAILRGWVTANAFPSIPHPASNKYWGI